ncbi:MAG TPA: DUF533 domain-containing protein [Geminicoccaceae bacterium]
MMFDPTRLLDQMVRSNLGHKKRKKGSGFGGAAFGGVDGLARRAGVPGGGLGLLGGLAIAAFEHFNQQRATGTAAPGHMPPPTVTPPPPPPGGPGARATPPPPPPPGARPTDTPPAGAGGAPGDRGSAVVIDDRGDDRPEVAADKAMLLIEAMIEAAKADGEIDPGERRRILERLEGGGLDPEARSFIEARMALPPASDRLVERVRPESPENRVLAAEVYVASLLAIEVDTPAERAYLRTLGERLKLDDGLLRHLHDDLGVERP